MEGFQSVGRGLHKGSETEAHEGGSRGDADQPGAQKVFTAPHSAAAASLRQRAGPRRGGGVGISCLCFSETNAHHSGTQLLHLKLL